MTNAKTVLVTGSAGFIGFWLCRALLEAGCEVHGVDNLSPYYDVGLKRDRLAQLKRFDAFHQREIGVEDHESLRAVWERATPDAVVHLAGQAGVRHSIDAPREYVTSNLIGAFNVLECARNVGCGHLLMASTSSVYGANTQMPYKETDKADTPMSFYAATKKSNEAMAHSYAHLFGFPVTMFRFFTVYGPWGRPDMAPFLFTNAILKGEPIKVFNHGEMKRDFTYVADLVRAVTALIDAVPDKPVSDVDSLSPVAPFRVVNIGNDQPVALGDFIAAIEAATGRKAERMLMDIQPGDVPATWADTRLLKGLTGFVPETALKVGIGHYVEWFMSYHGTDGGGGS